ncbi:hypothetical protein FGG08_002535 [Glutinoglossum americanum]|uniref:Mitochondrial import receptor subunit n=1 Tax=Glutinoglossum americanum TaxID=1670608 RepID=A0A9P8I9F5_9PEZI|nr:hypothetical protein FGG08_002535 [Glutinoglossum americanum]
MILELHVWGPAFTLPSIDPQCLAAIAYLTHVVPRDHWVLIAGDASALSSTRWDLDAGLTRDERADCIAFSSLVEANARSLLDLSLFVSSKNYEAVTRPLYSAVLPWPIQYFSLPKLRSAAKARTDHLGFSSLDVDTAGEKEASTSAAASASLIPPSLRHSKETLRTVLTQPVHASQFRLDALIASVLDPLQELLGEKQFFLSDTQVSSLDCLVLGYLALFLYPDLPQSWLADTMRRKYARLCGYVSGHHGRFFGCPITIHDFRIANHEVKLQELDGSRAAHYTVLPWATPNTGGFVQISSLLLESVTDLLPLNHIPKINRTNGTTGGIHTTNADSDSVGIVPRNWALSSQVLATVAGVSAALGYLLYAGLSQGERQEKTSLRDLGEAGAILSGIVDYRATAQEQRPPENGSSSD